MVYTLDLSGDLETNEVFQLIQRLIVQIKANAKDEAKQTLLLLLKNVLESSAGAPESEALIQRISALTAKTE